MRVVTRTMAHTSVIPAKAGIPLFFCANVLEEEAGFPLRGNDGEGPVLVRLICHPGTPCAAVEQIEVTVSRAGHMLALHYHVDGAIEALRLPATATPVRTDGLWQHSCFEAFLRGEDGYQEFNFSPSTRWAAYRFEGYREGMRGADAAAPEIRTAITAERFELRVAIDLPDGATRLGLAAVIEETSGRKSYWALAHPPGAPDFHHSDCFALDLAAAMDP